MPKGTYLPATPDAIGFADALDYDFDVAAHCGPASEEETEQIRQSMVAKPAAFSPSFDASGTAPNEPRRSSTTLTQILVQPEKRGSTTPTLGAPVLGAPASAPAQQAAPVPVAAAPAAMGAPAALGAPAPPSDQPYFAVPATINHGVVHPPTLGAPAPIPAPAPAAHLGGPVLGAPIPAPIAPAPAPPMVGAPVLGAPIPAPAPVLGAPIPAPAMYMSPPPPPQQQQAQVPASVPPPPSNQPYFAVPANLNVPPAQYVAPAPAPPGAHVAPPAAAAAAPPAVSDESKILASTSRSNTATATSANSHDATNADVKIPRGAKVITTETITTKQLPNGQIITETHIHKEIVVKKRVFGLPGFLKKKKKDKPEEDKAKEEKQ